MGQQWEDCDEDIRGFLNDVVSGFRDFLDVNLTGVYLHGSLATGCYNRAKSDIDLLIVVKKPLDEDERRRFALLCVTFSDRRPTPGDVELSVILEGDARKFTHPLPFEVHYSEDHRDTILRGRQDYSQSRTDRNLAAHCTVVRARGVRLVGAPIQEVFGAVPFGDYLDAILYDLDWILKEDTSLESPQHYGALNICRVFQVLEQGEGTVPTKEEGAAWALGHLPSEHHALISHALQNYQSSVPISEASREPGGLLWDKNELLAFRDYAATWIAEPRARSQPVVS